MNLLRLGIPLPLIALIVILATGMGATVGAHEAQTGGHITDDLRELDTVDEDVHAEMKASNDGVADPFIDRFAVSMAAGAEAAAMVGVKVGYAVPWFPYAVVTKLVGVIGVAAYLVSTLSQFLPGGGGWL